MANVDVFESSTGGRQERFFCHRGFTKAHPNASPTPNGYAPRGRLHFVSRCFQCLGRGLKDFWRMMCPRIQFGIGINLFRVN